MQPIRLESRDPKTNRARFYVLYIARALWGAWTLRREWGRIGQRARGVRVDECDSQDEALLRAAEIIELRLRHRYVVKNH